MWATGTFLPHAIQTALANAYSSALVPETKRRRMEESWNALDSQQPPVSGAVTNVTRKAV
jgi:hypothetical protein